MVLSMRYIENKLKEALKLDKGMGCEIPVLDPFAKEVTQFDKVLPKIKCLGKDWVKCYHANCRLVDEIKETHKHIKCSYRDILYQSDLKYVIGPVWESPDGSYELKASDHAKVTCKGVRISDPAIGTFQYRFNGFANQPADHYLRAFYLEESASVKWWKTKKGQYCFLELDGKRFIFTFIADITHDDFNMIQSADDDTAALLRNLQRYNTPKSATPCKASLKSACRS
ncbi:hypothetical protein MSG28_015805 [Choristoneura fumiferana]|uniref:Uncharacterized protein n=1 Tax=Choristoneura fumiferana TaxID=7141 RepID=A0ACC0KBF9_CHOFU|nr:hypothetical protein MSG28_015805 [Choristoneura fumiferana]